MDSGRLEVPNGTVHLDTVRALHQTVVSLRTALECSKNELKELKEKYERHSHCLEYADVIEKLTLENHVLRRRIIDTSYEDSPQNIKLEVTYSPRASSADKLSEVVIETAHLSSTKDSETAETHQEEEQEDILEPYPDENTNFCSSDKLNEIPEVSESPELNQSVEYSPVNTQEESQSQSQVISLPKQEHLPSFRTKLELLSKFDVRIKVRTLKEGTVLSSTTSDSDSVDGKKDKAEFQFEQHQEKFDKTEDSKGNTVNFSAVSSEIINMAVPNEADKKTDKFDVQVRITSEENLEIKENITERSRRKDTLNLDVDDLSLRSMSEGDNSVFSEGGTTPIEPCPVEDKQEQEASGNESEEVDDIELIFTTDESKDMSNLQEDLVSIKESDSWAPNSASTTHSTPVLIKFHTLDPDFQPGTDTAGTDNQENSNLQGITASSLKMKRVSLPNDKEIRHVAFNGKERESLLDLPGRGILKSCDNRSDNMLYRKSPNTSTRRLDSVDSLACDYNQGLSLDTKSSSFELGSSMDILHRDESIDSFHKTGHLGHRFSVFAERDISKCGTSEDDLAVSLNIRRNTCPNPFQYRVPPYRGVSRAPGPFKAAVGVSRLRPVSGVRDAHRRENAAQTDLTALPNRWSSDGYLAHKMCVGMVGTRDPPTLPQRASVTSRRARPPPPPAKRNDDTRRVLLSDIGFTSMVPELSRSADPVWALAKKQGSDETITNSTSKFLSRGSSYRSPCVSIDRSTDWTPQTVYVPTREYVGWRSSLPDVRARDDTDDLLQEAEAFVRRSIDNLHDAIEVDVKSPSSLGQPYIPASHKQLRLGHTVKVITPQGRIAVGRVRYVGLAGGTAASSSIVVGVELCMQSNPCLPRNDGTHRGRRYFLTPPHYTALFVPFSKVVMAWAI